MTTASLPALQPLRMGQLLDRAIRLYRRNFLRFVGIVAVVQIPLSLLRALVSLFTFGQTYAQMQDLFVGSIPGGYMDPATAYVLGTLGNLALTLVDFLLIQGIATAALSRAIGDHYLGYPCGFLQAYRRVGKSWLRLIGALLFSVALTIGLVIWLLVPCVGWLTGMGLLLFFWQAIVPLVAPAVVLEGQSAVGAIRRAWDLLRRRFWWVTGFVVILYVLNLLIVGGPGALINAILEVVLVYSAGLDSIYTGFVLQTIAQSLATLALSLVYLPLQITALTLMYFDLRVRTEGFDLTLRAEHALHGQVDVAGILAQAPGPAAAGEPLVTWKEMGNLALLSLGIMGVCGVPYVILLFFLVTLMRF